MSAINPAAKFDKAPEGRFYAFSKGAAVSGADRPTHLYKMDPTLSEEQVAAALKHDGYRQVAFKADGDLWVLQSEDLCGGEWLRLGKQGDAIDIVRVDKDGNKQAVLKGKIFATDTEHSYGMRSVGTTLAVLGIGFWLVPVLGPLTGLLASAGSQLGVGACLMGGAMSFSAGLGLKGALDARQEKSTIEQQAVSTLDIANAYFRR